MGVSRAIKMGITARPGQSKSSMVVQGGVLQCLEAATLGMPFEVWKTRMGRFRTEGTMEAFHNVKKSGGYKMFWQGTSAKMVESATKGGVLLVAKETIKDSCMGAGMGGVAAGFADAVRSVMLTATGGNGQGKLTVGQEVFSGMLGGMLACWNHPFEVARIEMQARAAAGESKK